MSTLQCGRCTACCKRELVPLMPGDDMGLDAVSFQGVQVLRHKENGDCIYLGKRGCKIYDRRPQVCRSFDCRKFALGAMRGIGSMLEVRKDPDVIRAGMERMNTLTQEDVE